MANRLFQKLPPLSSLIAFEAAYRHSSFTRAADELALSQASVSRRIRELEENLGVELFHRRRYDVEATAHGDRLARTARPALNEIADTSNQIRQANATANSVTVFSDICLGSTFVAPVAAQFQRAYPDVNLRILASYESIETTAEDFDVGLQYGNWAPHRYEISKLLSENIVPVCCPAVAEQLGPSPAPEDLLKFPLIHLADVGRSWSGWQQLFNAHGVEDPKMDNRLLFSSYQVCLDVAEKGDGIALGWETTSQDRISRGSLVSIDSMSVDLGETINLHLPRDRKLSKPAQAFLDLMLAHFALTERNAA